MSQAHTKSPIISVQKVHKSFASGDQTLHILQDLNLEIAEGEFVCIVGTSGSGKSTLLHLIGGLDSADSGNIIVNGSNLRELNDQQISAFRNQTLGFVFQDFFLLPQLTVAENIELPLQLNKKRTTASDKSVQHKSPTSNQPSTHDHQKSAHQSQTYLTDLIARLGLQDRLNHLPSQISGGQKQRTAIGRALAAHPPILLADEPTGNLDFKTAQEILDLLLALKKTYNMTLVIVTHDHNLAKLADRTIVLEHGKVHARSAQSAAKCVLS